MRLVILYAIMCRRAATGVCEHLELRKVQVLHLHLERQLMARRQDRCDLRMRTVLPHGRQRARAKLCLQSRERARFGVWCQHSGESSAHLLRDQAVASGSSRLERGPTSFSLFWLPVTKLIEVGAAMALAPPAVLRTLCRVSTSPRRLQSVSATQMMRCQHGDMQVYDTTQRRSCPGCTRANGGGSAPQFVRAELTETVWRDFVDQAAARPACCSVAQVCRCRCSYS